MPALLENIGRVVNWTGRKVGRAFGYDATRPKNKRRKVVALERSEDAELKQSDRSKVITTARDLPRNFTIAAWMVRKHLDYVSTFKFHCRHKNEEVNRKVEAFIKRWSKRKNCDVSGRFNLKRIIRMCEARRTLDGDVLIVKLADGRLQIIESDRVRTPVGGVPDTNPTDFTFGVKTRDGGEQVAFSVCKRAKVSDFGSSGQAFEFERIIPAANAYLHGYFDRFDQTRGISPMAPAINTLQDTYEGFDYALCKLKIAQLFGLLTLRNSDEDLGEVEEDEDGNKEVDFGKGPVNLDLKVGEDAKIIESKNPSMESQQFLQVGISVSLKSLDIPYSFYAENFSNYSGSRQALLQYEQSAETKREDNRELLDELTSWRLAMAIEDGELDLGDVSLDELTWEWVSIGIPWIDPEKEVNADIKLIGSCMSSRTRRLKERGEDFYEIADELASENKYLKDRGLPTELPGMASPPANQQQDQPEPPLTGDQLPDVQGGTSNTDQANGPASKPGANDNAD